MGKMRKLPQRMCVGCREMKNKRELIRIVRTPEGNVEVDRTGKRAGRGAYVCPSQNCLDQAVKGQRLQKALEKEIPAELLQRIKEEVTGTP
ncbi:MAG TPA: YlxR family protein [Syntrophomonadaceae bacterium]|nr:YlxR family protein [Syntrophomonadaceae bacterium]